MNQETSEICESHEKVAPRFPSAEIKELFILTSLFVDFVFWERKGWKDSGWRKAEKNTLKNN